MSKYATKHWTVWYRTRELRKASYLVRQSMDEEPELFLGIYKRFPGGCWQSTASELQLHVDTIFVVSKGHDICLESCLRANLAVIYP